jgi:hypothetical protein
MFVSRRLKQHRLRVVLIIAMKITNCMNIKMFAAEGSVPVQLPWKCVGLW